ncbi:MULTISPECIES: helix-turn-helix transcriptional regulator [unclassified Paenibacillus]|uniref:helix-turn-helix transcriptional regulator n=1 Tax=unclassified Paenibacillus TaxID=185978 RepID=UPI002108D32D|nr:MULTISPECIES: helix-turn-helix transcriptional regulator [unclassified Paenibacillus]
MQIPKPHMGMLHALEGAKRFQLTRHAPAEVLASFVKHYWIVSWELPDQEAYPQLVVPNPCVNLVVERGKTACYAPGTSTYSYVLRGQGCVFGVKFKPGGFYPFIREPISGLQGNPMPVDQVVDASGDELEGAILGASEEAEMVRYMERCLLARLPEPDAQAELAGQIIERITEDRSISKVDMICDDFQIHKRALQRLFDQYVGISLKWVIRLLRIQNAAEAMDTGLRQDLLRLSMDLGYHDQAHFIKDFKAMVGQTPDAYAKLSIRSIAST